MNKKRQVHCTCLSFAYRTFMLFNTYILHSFFLN